MRARKKSFVIVSFNKLFFDFYRELGMLGSPTLDSLSSAAGDVKYPADCYSPKFMDQRDTYRGNSASLGNILYLFTCISLFS